MSFAISTPPIHNNENTTIAQAWWPDLSIKTARELLRLDGNVTTTRLLEAITNARYSVNDELLQWQLMQIDKGVEQLLGEREEHLYQRAVYFYAHAELLDRYRNYDTTGAGEKKAIDLDKTIGDLRRLAWSAVSDIQGISRVVVEML